jgi:hypothetical protein
MRKTVILGSLLAFGLAGPALADGHLVGTWSTSDSEGRGARMGASDHGLEGNFMQGLDEGWSLTITDQQGSGVHAEWCSPNTCEQAVGVIRADGETLLMVDEDGTFMGTVMGDEMELCYLEPGSEFMVADCHMLARQ